MSTLLTLSYGTYPELIEATLRILMEAGAILEIETVQLGEEMKKLGFDKGFDEDVLKKIRCSGVLLKGVNAEIESKDLCAALEINATPESFGEGADAALGYTSERYAIFEPAIATPQSALNAAIMALHYLQQSTQAQLITQAASGINSLSPESFADAVVGKLY